MIKKVYPHDENKKGKEHLQLLSYSFPLFALVYLRMQARVQKGAGAGVKDCRRVCERVQARV